MKCARPKLWALLALVLCITSAVVLISLRRHAHSAGAWLHVSAPDFSLATNPADQHRLMVVLVSNAGPSAVEFRLRWFDSRVKGDLASAAVPRSPNTARALLPSRTGTRVTWDFKPNTPKEEYLCCCAFDWQQHPSWVWRAAARWVDPLLVWIQNCIQPGWKAYTWSLADWLEPLAEGLVFTSNIRVDDYFHLVYGLDRVKALEVAAPPQTSAATNASNAGLAERSNSRALQAPLEVQRAFNAYCVATAQQPGQ